jgi:putative hydroxymethylpyrimidine transport system substrate-binding protein
MPTRPELRRRGVLLAASLICVALCAGCGEVHPQTTLGTPRPVTVAIADPPSALYASLYTAKADGDFSAGALGVTITHPPNALRALETGGANIAISSEPALLAARASGAQLVAVGALIRQPLDGIVSLASQPIARARALLGRTIAISPTPLAAAELSTVLASAHLAASSVRRMTVNGSLESALHSRRVAATLGDLWALDAVALKLSHQPATVLEIQQAGVPTYSQLVIVVRVGEAHDKGPLLRAFLQSLTRGERAVVADPAAAAATLAKVNPRLSAAFERALLAETLPIASPTGHLFGYQDPYAWQAFGAWMHRHGLLADAPDAGLAITDEFLPGQGA